MSTSFSLSDATYDMLARQLRQTSGKFPVLTKRIKWTPNETWTLTLPINLTSIRVRGDVMEERWIIEAGSDRSIHVKVNGTRKFDELTHLVFSYRPSVNLISKDLTTMMHLLRTTNFKMEIRAPDGTMIEKGQFTELDCLAVRCVI